MLVLIVPLRAPLLSATCVVRSVRMPPFSSSVRADRGILGTAAAAPPPRAPNSRSSLTSSNNTTKSNSSSINSTSQPFVCFLHTGLLVSRHFSQLAAISLLACFHVVIFVSSLRHPPPLPASADAEAPLRVGPSPPPLMMATQHASTEEPPVAATAAQVGFSPLSSFLSFSLHLFTSVRTCSIERQEAGRMLCPGRAGLAPRNTPPSCTSLPPSPLAGNAAQPIPGCLCGSSLPGCHPHHPLLHRLDRRPRRALCGLGHRCR